MSRKRKQPRPPQKVSNGEATTGRRAAESEAWHRSKRPVLRFVLIFAVVMVLFHVLFFARWAGGAPLFESYLGLNAQAAGSALRVGGHETTVQENTLMGRGVSLTIVRGCDALQPIALFVSAAVAMPAPLLAKLLGVVSGVATLLTLNMVRILTLFYTRLHYPRAFDFLHYDLWQVVFIFVAILLWVIWARWAVGRRRPKRYEAGATD